jgi:hypothetical protein
MVHNPLAACSPFQIAFSSTEFIVNKLLFILLAPTVLTACLTNPTAKRDEAPQPTATTQPAQPAGPGARREVAGVNDWKGYVEGVPAANTKFNMLKIGMGEKEVTDLIGMPTDQGQHITGKAFIPFYYGSGGMEKVYHYKGFGRLRFANSSAFSTTTGLVGIEHDSKERGYR